MSQPISRNLAVVSIGVSISEVCGVRDFADLLSAELRRKSIAVRDVWADQRMILGRRTSRKSWLSALENGLAAEPADALLLHYSVFSYSWRGLPMHTGQLVRRMRRVRLPIVTLLHEYIYPWGHRGWRGFLQAATQRIALLPIVGMSSELIVTTNDRREWLLRQRWLPQRTVTAIPVFSNVLPENSKPRRMIPTAIIFGYTMDGGICDPVVEGVANAAKRIDGLELLLVGAPGPEAAASARWQAAASRTGCRLSFTGVLTRSDLSRTLSTATLAIFVDSPGPTSRKTTLAALLAHGCPVIACDGPQTWHELVEAGAVIVVPPEPGPIEHAIVRLCTDVQRRESQSKLARDYYHRQISIKQAGDAFEQILRRSSARRHQAPHGRNGHDTQPPTLPTKPTYVQNE